jgi:hypothetical protein
MQRMTPLEPSGDYDSPTYPLRQIVDTAEPQREQPMEPWGNAGRSGPLARRVSHRVPRGRRTAGNRSRRHSTAWPSNLPGACGTEHFGELADPCGRDSQAVCLRDIVPMIDPRPGPSSFTVRGANRSRGCRGLFMSSPRAAALEYQLLLTSFAASSIRRCPGDGLTGRHAETVRNWEALILRGRPRGNGPPRAGQQLRDPPIHVETSGDQAIVPRERHNQQTLVPWLGDPFRYRRAGVGCRVAGPATEPASALLHDAECEVRNTCARDHLGTLQLDGRGALIEQPDAIAKQEGHQI